MISMMQVCSTSGTCYKVCVIRVVIVIRNEKTDLSSVQYHLNTVRELFLSQQRSRVGNLEEVDI